MGDVLRIYQFNTLLFETSTNHHYQEDLTDRFNVSLHYNDFVLGFRLKYKRSLYDAGYYRPSGHKAFSIVNTLNEKIINWIGIKNCKRNITNGKRSTLLMCSTIHLLFLIIFLNNLLRFIIVYAVLSLKWGSIGVNHSQNKRKCVSRLQA